MSQDTNVENLIINKLTKAQFESITTPDPTQLYFITDEVISSADVTNALGYIPYNAINPEGYTSNIGTVTSVNNTQPDASGNVTLTIPDTSNLANKDLSNLSSTGNAKFQAPLVSGTNIKTINNNSLLGNGNLTLDGLPTQTGQSGKFLTTDGTDASWGNLPIATASTVGVVKPDNASIRVDNNGTLSAICRNVGEIISSTLPLTDAGLHLLDGGLILGGGIQQGFVDYIAKLYGDGTNIPSYFCTEAEWQTSVTTYGVCGKFVYNSTNNTVRLPKITGIIEGTTDINALGDLVEAGLPNIKGWFDIVNTTQRDDVLFQSVGSGANSGATGGGTIRLQFNANTYNPIYKDNATIQPQTIKALYYIVIATSTKTDIQVNIDDIVTDLNGKVDKSDLHEVQCVVETYVNGNSWYRIYSDGWCEQGGRASVASDNSVTVTFLKNFKDTNYYANWISCSGAITTGSGTRAADTLTTTSMRIYNGQDTTMTANWQACGYIEV